MAGTCSVLWILGACCLETYLQVIPASALCLLLIRLRVAGWKVFADHGDFFQVTEL